MKIPNDISARDEKDLTVRLRHLFLFLRFIITPTEIQNPEAVTTTTVKWRKTIVYPPGEDITFSGNITEAKTSAFGFITVAKNMPPGVKTLPVVFISDSHILTERKKGSHHITALKNLSLNFPLKII